MARKDAEHSGPMDERQATIQRRRLALGLTLVELQNESGVGRDTIAAYEKGQGARTDKLNRVLAALDRLEAEAGMDAPPATSSATPEGLVRFEFDMPGEGHVRGYVEGPVADAEALSEKVRAILRGTPPNHGAST